MDISTWIDKRFGESVEAALAQIEAQEHRRFLKSHLPLDGLPFYDEVKYIHVARDGRDACISYHNHITSYTADTLQRFDEIGLQDETIGRPYPRPASDPAEFFHCWVTDTNVPSLPFFAFERTWWEGRHLPNVLLVHYNNLKADLAGEMQRVADFLSIKVAPTLWPELVSAASFDAMRRSGDTLMSSLAHRFQGGSQRFFYRGVNGRWLGVFKDEDLALYDAGTRNQLSPSCADWIIHGGQISS